MAKYTKEMEIWFEQQENRKQSCLRHVEFLFIDLNNLNKKIELLQKEMESCLLSIELEKQQIECIEEDTENGKKEWNYGKE